MMQDIENEKKKKELEKQIQTNKDKEISV